MRILPVTAFSLAALTPALAGSDNVVMVAVAHVTVPAKLPGLCRLDGTVRHVWQGEAFHEGQALSLKIPCGTDALMPLPGAQPTRLSGPRLIDPQVLSASTLGAAHIDDSGNLMWQPANGSGGGIIWGYRVLQGVRLRLGQSA
jgi:hypothetical protein